MPPSHVPSIVDVVGASHWMHAEMPDRVAAEAIAALA